MGAAPTAINHTMTTGEWGLLLLLSLLWGGTFFFVEIALTAVPPFTLVFLRVALGAVVLVGLVKVLGKGLPQGIVGWRPFLVMGALNNVVPFSLIFWGQTELTGGLAAVFNATTPIFTAILAHVATNDEKLTGSRIAGLLLGFAGVAVMMGSDVLAGLGGTVLAQAAILAASMSYAVAGLSETIRL